MAVIRPWSIRCPDPQLGAWALDEFKAYRQIPIAQDQRKLAVVAVVNPNPDESGTLHPRTEYVIMNGHCFGLQLLPPTAGSPQDPESTLLDRDR